MHDLVGIVLPFKRSGDTPFQGMSTFNVGDLRQVSQVQIALCCNQQARAKLFNKAQTRAALNKN